MYSLIRPVLFGLEPEKAHDLTLKMLSLGNKTRMLDLFGTQVIAPTKCMGIRLVNAVGLSAGLDKNGAYLDALAALGFGFLEIGTTTPKPQAGNAQPRLFRLVDEGAIINRMGFNNEGVDALVRNVERAKYNGILGINIGKNATTDNEHALDDYLYCLERVYVHASYVTINISSPNTKNLRDLQQKDELERLMQGLKDAQSRLASQHGFYVPMAVKVAPDVSNIDVDAMSQVFLEHEIDGVIATNTSLERKGIEDDPQASEAGGLSGRPIRKLSNEVLGQFADALGGKVDLIGVGGIDDPKHAIKKLKLGAQAVQLYTGLIYKGAGLVSACAGALADYQDDDA